MCAVIARLSNFPDTDAMGKTRGVKVSLFGLVILVATAGGCGSDGLITKGEFCSRTGGPICDRFISCGLVTAADKGDCTAEYQVGCCGDDNSCGERSSSKDAEMQIEAFIADCTAAAPTADCTELANGNPPVACGGTAIASLSLTLSAGVAAPGTHTRALRIGRLTARTLFGPSMR